MPDAFHGNQYVSVCKVGAWAKAAGPWAAGAGFAWDTYGMFTGNESPAKWGVNSGFGTLGFWGGPGGALAAGGYFIIDSTYPGGAAAYAPVMGNAASAGMKNGTWLP